MAEHLHPEAYDVPRRKPTEIDRNIGGRLKLRRTLLGISQAELGQRCFVSPQQIHKYEQGQSRMTVSRLIQFAAALETPVSWFVENVEAFPSLPEDLVEIMASKEVGEMILLMRQIPEARLRRGLLEMARQCADVGAASAPSQDADADEQVARVRLVDK